MRMILFCLGAALIASACDNGGVHEPPPPSFLVIVPKQATLPVGRDSQFVANAEGYYGPGHPIVSWRSTFPDVASVDSLGLVTARSRGGTYIIVRATGPAVTREDTAAVAVP